MNMKKLVYLLLLFFVNHVRSAPQSDNLDANSELDYSEPGLPSDDCLCVPFYLCEDGEIVDDGRNILDPRKKPQEEELALDEKYTPPECGPYHVCCRNPETSTAKPYEHKCGMRNPGGVNGRILVPHATGEAEFGEWPWQAAILRKDGSEYVFKCGGTLIDEKHVLTVAHCVDKMLDDMASIVVRLGEWDLKNPNDILPHEDYGVVDVFMHPQYRSNNLHNDIAIIKLDKDVVFKPHIDTACLPRDEDDFTGHECVVTGWGTDAYKNGAYSLIMKEVNVPVISNDECQGMLRKTRLGKYFKLHGGFLCAGGKEGEDSCKGDGGGPLVCFRSDNTYTVAGLVSWGIECGQSRVPGVYVNVKKYINWIASKTQKPVEEYWST